MAYVVFDLDETLAHLHSMYYFIASLNMKQDIVENRSYLLSFLPEDLFDSQKRAYRLFVKRVLEAETSDRPLGILRPGVLEVMSALRELQQKGKVAHVVLYSNNRHLPCLKFVRDLIHLHVRSTFLIGECIHWDHVMRHEDKMHPAFTKSWNVLRGILMEGRCKAPDSLSAKHVYFFDDLDHIDLQHALKEQYYKVPAYSYTVALDRISQIYIEVLEEAKPDWSTFLFTVMDYLQVGERTVQLHPADVTVYDMVRTFWSHIEPRKETEDVPPPPDLGYMMMMDVVRELDASKKPRRQKRRTMRARRYTVKIHQNRLTK
jgi:hypothetical protein